MKISRFTKSQRAHSRLFEKYNNKFGSFADDIKAAYHNRAYEVQRISGRVITKKDRKILYSWAHNKVMGYGVPGSNITEKDRTAMFRRYGVYK